MDREDFIIRVYCSGPPASGKSTYVSNNRLETDIVTRHALMRNCPFGGYCRYSINLDGSSIKKELVMSLSNGDYPKFNLVVIVAVLEELGINLETGYLINREKLGIPLREALAKKLYAMKEDTLVINMVGIEEMTTSVADEIGPLLFEDFIKHRKRKDVFLTYCNVTDEIAKGLHNSFAGPKSGSIVVFSNYQDGIFSNHQFLGQEIPTALRDILEVIYNFGVVNSSDLEEQGIKAASRKLNELAKYYPWLFCKVQKSLDTGSRAWAYFYSPIVPAVEKVGVK